MRHSRSVAVKGGVMAGTSTRTESWRWRRRFEFPACASVVTMQCCILGILLLLVPHPPRPASAQSTGPGFVSVDCGASTGGVDNLTGIPFDADTSYIATGNTSNVKIDSTWAYYYLKTLRYFPAATSPKKNCYDLTVDASRQYLVRATFYHGGYAPLPSSGVITFKLALDASPWSQVTYSTSNIDSASTGTELEAIVMTKGTSLSVCLIRTSDGIEGVPFINAVELRPVRNNMYLGRYDVPSKYFLKTLDRPDFGPPLAKTRYPEDECDRIWLARTSDFWLWVNKTFSPFPGDPKFIYDTVPNTVLQSAIGDDTFINYTLHFDSDSDVDPVKQLYVSVFFAEVGVGTTGSTRILDVSGNVFNLMGIRISDHPLNYFQLVGTAVSGSQGYITVEVRRNNFSDSGPILNACEVYNVREVALGTDVAQAAVLAGVKANLSRGVWSGDPCLPVPWVGLSCIVNQVTSIDLSNQGCTGSIPNFSGLTSLVPLNLSNNAFSGFLPPWVADMPSLQTLDVSSNQLTGTFPASLLNRITGFRYSNNLELSCLPADGSPCPASPPALTSPPPPGEVAINFQSEIRPSLVITAVVVIAAIVGCVWLCCFCCKRARKVDIQQPLSPLMNMSLAAPSTLGTPLNVAAVRDKAQPFTLQSIREATNNFSRKLGEGGFGPVYYGMLTSQQEVAVKVMSGKTRQGLSEFTNEIDLLSTVHYNKLVSLVGYCQEGSDLILLYDYLSGGDLRQRLYVPKSLQAPLNWRQRLRIALDAAKGLEYLHHGCTPAILHRDVKSSNILLTENLEAKVSDFGLSKLLNRDQSHVTTEVKGTLGYLDPEYQSTGILTDKSDVYSFGVVLLELLSGQPPIVKEGSQNKFLVDKVRAVMKRGTLQSVTDPELQGQYTQESAWKLAEVAMCCVAVSGASRPGMTKVVAKLAEVLEMEFRLGVGSSSNSNYNSSGDLIHFDTFRTPEPPSQTFHQDVSPLAR